MAKANKYLIDTHVFLWWLSDDKHLSTVVKEIIADPSNIILLSLMSAWEIAIKQSVGKLKLPVPIDEIITSGDFTILSLDISHITESSRLPFYHKDPFDRMLIAQSKVEELTIISDDPQFKKYKVSLIY